MFSLHPSRLIRQPAPDKTRRVRPLEFTIPILPLYMLLRPEARNASLEPGPIAKTNKHMNVM
ncbi:hypothetical protein K0M31_012694 [Melipona bicolor]|uniref:Uncharacterized protein n=1 Tax=Melipona bicolor TaxID=60889 RepID=A0AA40FJE3_9HYME|nr:hypothetical protein K0M31_012694 [Melipona bicolor]